MATKKGGARKRKPQRVDVATADVLSYAEIDHLLVNVAGEQRSFWTERRKVRGRAFQEHRWETVTARYLRAMPCWRWARVFVEMRKEELLDPYGVADAVPDFVSVTMTVEELGGREPGTYAVVLTAPDDLSGRRIRRIRDVLEGRARQVADAAASLAEHAERKGMDAGDALRLAERMRGPLLVSWNREAVDLMERVGLLAQRLDIRMSLRPHLAKWSPTVGGILRRSHRWAKNETATR